MATAVPAPKKIGRYEVERLLGQGGMGRVWLAKDTVLGRSVAIKVLRDDLALPPTVRDELIERMRHEARAAAAVSHPNIVTLHDMGEDDAIGLFLVFEYVAGPDGRTPQTLRDRLSDGALPLADVAKLARELGSAVSFAHEAGVIHRDIKPENVLFARTGAKIADFGIARIPESTITRTNTVLGTPAYTAPEALSKGTFGPASDQFSLAATLYEAATGNKAFGAEDAMATAGKVSSEPPPPLEPTLGSAPAVRSLSAALQKGLAKEPSSRYASCAALGDAISRAISGPTEGATSLDALLGAASLEASASTSEHIEIERTPLSSRVALAERVARISDRPPVLTPYGESRPSIMIRKKTHRLQNVVAAAALIVIVVLILMGRKQHDDEKASKPEAIPSATASANASASVKKAKPAASHAPPASASASASASADASPPPNPYD
ncbi:MAG: serine/threonine protein kinase [Labilithrix sp.]|nr:serine/threonine protein kinase [Labilithrix sp.]